MAIGSNNNKLVTRIQLKSDTETNWIANPIVPLMGEMIIYTPDAHHPYSRLKVGDGTTTVTNLPFIDAGTLNGDDAIIEKYENFNSFPSPGDPNRLYIDLATASLYHYTTRTGYTPLGQTGITVTQTTVHDVVHWGPGSMTTASVSSGILTIKNGIAPQLLTQGISVINSVTVSGGES